MQEIQLNMSDAEFERLNTMYPPTTGSSPTGKRAMELVQLYFRNHVNTGCEFRQNPRPGIDLAITHDGATEEIEVKGTAKLDLAWNQFKVSGRPSHDNLVADTPLYRVVGVYSRDPRIFIMKCSEDFDIGPEPRWTLKPKGTTNR